jgi:hypothetical protein
MPVKMLPSPESSVKNPIVKAAMINKYKAVLETM